MADFNRFHNQRVLYHGLESFIEKTALPSIHKRLVDRVLPQMEEAVGNMVESGQIPVYTGNLRNSIGIAIYKGGKLTKHSPIITETTEKGATQSAGAAVAGVTMYGIVGAALLQNAMNNPAKDVSGGFSRNSLHLIVYAGVPYAWWINDEGSPIGRGQRFYTNLAGFSVLWNILGREFYRGNKPFIEEATPIGL